MQPQTKTCQNCQQNFTIEPEDFNFYEKIRVPPPTFCPECRVQRRFAYRNERFLYKRESDLSGQEIFSMFPQNASFPVYTHNEWFSDAWNALQYGHNYDFSRTFFEQFSALSTKVPRPALAVFKMSNSDYSNNAEGLRNCYMCFNSNYSEDCLYDNGVDYSKNCVECSHVLRSEFCFQSFWLARCNRTFFSSRCEDCAEVFFSKNLRGCNNCFGCVNLHNKSYYIFNEPYTKEDYSRKIKEFNFGSHLMTEGLRNKVQNFWPKFPNKFMEGTRNVEVTGSYIYNSKNVHNSYLIRNGKDLRFCQYLQAPSSEDCYDHSIYGLGNTLTYECVICGSGTNNIRFCVECWPDVKNLEYCHYCTSSSDLFGCIGLRKRQYCILNKQYTEEEYKNLVSKIREHMNQMPYTDKGGRIYRYGEFFPIELSSYGYNETIAQEHFPLDQEGTEKQGFNWRKPQDRDYKITIPADKLSDQITDASNTTTDEIIGCAHEGKCNHECTTAFRMVTDEFNFYRYYGLALPRLCQNCRHRERISQRNPLKLWHRKCQCTGSKSDNGVYANTAKHLHGDDHCSVEFETSYAPERPEIVYCEKCYQQEMY